MTTEQIKNFLAHVKQSNLTWDRYDRALALVGDPKAFQEFCQRNLSVAVYGMLFIDPTEAPIYVGSQTPWLKCTAEWILKNNTQNSNTIKEKKL